MKKKLLFGVLGIVALWGALGLDWSSPPRDGSCAFCKKEVYERQLVYRGEVASIIATHKPVVKGHLLVIPNRHVERFDGLTGEELAEIGALMKRAHLTEEYLVLQKNGALSGESVPHVHVHILPRSERLSLVGFVVRFFLNPLKKPLTHEEMKAYVTEMSQALGE